MKKILLIQPHSDDIVFSCFHKLMEDAEITIFTAENVEKRIKEDKKLEDLYPNITVIPGIKIDDQSYYEYFKSNKSVFDKVSALSCVQNFISEEQELEICEILFRLVEENKYDEVYTCLGIGHPFHLLIHELTKDIATHFYRDWPHSYKKRNKAFLEMQETIFKLDYEECDEDMLEIKLETAKLVYKSQSSLLFFEQGNIKKNFTEKIYTLK